MKLSVCIDPLFPGMAAHEKIYKIAEAGIHNVDMWAWRDKDVHALKEACQQTGVQVVNMNGHRTGSMVARQTHSTLVADVTATIPVARDLGCTYFMMITNQLNGDDGASRTLKSRTRTSARMWSRRCAIFWRLPRLILP